MPRTRRYPRYGRFLSAGATAGVLVALVVTALAPASPEYSRTALGLYLALTLALIGALVAGAVAVVSESRGRRGHGGSP